MDYVIVCLIGVFGGGFAVFIALDSKRRRLDKQRQEQDLQAESIRSDSHILATKKEELDQLSKSLTKDQSEFNARAISYHELQGENTILKHDLKNLDINIRKMQLDHQQQRHTQEALDAKIQELGSRYLRENVKWIGASLTPNNFSNCKQRLQDVIERCRGVGFDVPASEETSLLAALQEEYKNTVRAAFDREEQARIKAQMREELNREKEKDELERKQQQLERERDAMKAAVELAVAKALAEAKDQHSAEIQQMNEALANKQAEIDANQRAISQAQITKLGHVYVISNIGSFGDGVFKVGMTRRLEPEVRVDELGAASVPFPFDVHMMIKCTNAPTLETELHRKLFGARINKANPRKEFFKTDLDTIKKIVTEHGGDVEYRTDNLVAEAEEYRQSLSMPDDVQQIIQSAYDDLGDEGELVEDEGS